MVFGGGLRSALQQSGGECSFYGGWMMLYLGQNLCVIPVEHCLSITDLIWLSGRRGGLMVSALDCGASAPGSSLGRGQCVVFLGKTLYSHSTSLHPGV